MFDISYYNEDGTLKDSHTIEKEKDNMIIEQLSRISGVKYSDEQKEVLRHRGGMCILACAGSGKALRNDMPVLTPNGWKPIGEIKVGDPVYSDRGILNKVLGVYPQGEKEEYQIYFNDNTSVICSGDHLWFAGKIDPNQPNIRVSDSGVWNTEKLMQMMAAGYGIEIPLNKAVVFPEFDSYMSESVAYTMGINWGRLDKIPDELKFGKVRERKEFVRGLGDYVKNHSEDIEFIKFEFETKNKEIMNDTVFILRSLGKLVKVKENENSCGIKVYKAHVYLGETFRSPGKYTRKLITKIEKTGNKSEMTCIEVSGKNHLFITKDFIVTHNTTVLTHLIAKRVMSGEIDDTSKLLCTTYSRPGAAEMEERLGILLNKVGINQHVEVCTIHAVCRRLLIELGYKCNIIEQAQKMKFIREACKENEVQLDEEDIQVLESLFSFQINNLLGDSALYKSYVYTLRNVPLEKYSAIRKTFNTKKQEAGVVDFDDLQLLMYSIFINDKDGKIRNYFHTQKWKYIYVDEAQDVSKIQFAILKCLISDPKNLVFIGDDDQCLIEGTAIDVPGGAYNIEDIKEGDLVATSFGNGYIGYEKVTGVHKKRYKGKVITITTKNFHTITATPEHIAFARTNETDLIGKVGEWDSSIIYTMFDGEPVDKDFESKWQSPRFKSSIKTWGLNDKQIRNIEKATGLEGLKDGIIHNDLDILEGKLKLLEDDGLVVYKRAKLNDKVFDMIRFKDLEVGMEILSTLPCHHSYYDEIANIETYDYDGYVYDITVPTTRNFIANQMIVHNCIYEWRGADPSIILDVCGVYPELTQFKLTTNYRCYGDIVRQAAHGIQFNRSRSNKTMTPANEGGEIKIYDAGGSNIYKMSQPAYKYIRHLVIDEGVNPSEIAILSRNNQHLTILANMLFKDGIYCKTSDDMVFTKSRAYKIMKEVIKFAEDDNSGMNTKEVLWRLCPYMKKATSEAIGNVQTSCGARTSDLLGYMITKIGHRTDVEWEDNPIVIKGLSSSKLMAIWERMSGAQAETVIRIYQILKNPDFVKRAKAFMDMALINTGDFFFPGKENRRFADGVVAYLSDLLDTLGYDEFNRYIQVVTQYEYGKMAIISPMVSMATIHGSKGREWRYVIIFADDNISFPSFDGIQQCIKDGVSLADINGMIDESRRLHYVAMTRAKEQLVIFTDRKNVGVHVLESLNIMDYGRSNNQNIITMAQHGLYDELNIKSDSELFGSNSKYHIDIN